MPKLVWYNQPTNHSGTVNFLYLNPDGEVGQFTLYVADGGGPYILGGPALADEPGELTDAALTLISLLPAGFHFFPPSSEGRLRDVVQKSRKEITNSSSRLGKDWSLRVYSKTYSTTQCCDLLLNHATPDTAVVFVDSNEQGDVLLAAELARLYYGLSKEQRQELKLGPDWNHHWEG